MSEPILEDDQPQSSGHTEPFDDSNELANIFIDVENAPFPIETTRFESFVLCLMESAGEKDAELSVCLGDDSTIQKLNHQFRGQDCPTDVLSFSMREGEKVGQQYPLGDIFISVETAQRQAESFGNTLDEEINELLFHGFLHLLGYDHDGEARTAWVKAETRLIGELQRLDSPYCPKGMAPDLPFNPIKKR